MGTHRFEVSARGDHLYISQEGVLADLESAMAMQSEVEKLRDALGLTKAIFDNRATGIHDERIREAMWEWVTGAFGSVALLLESSMAAVRANMNAIAIGTRLRAFADEDEAVQWLRARPARHEETGSDG